MQRRIVLFCVALSLGGASAFSVWHSLPQGLSVNASELRTATVEQGVFNDDMLVRAIVKPLNSVMLDAVESGRVEEVLVRDGALLQKYEPLFRLSNPQRLLDLLARQSDQATQIANLSNLRANFEASITDHERRVSDFEFNLQQAEKQYQRNQQLAAQGFIANSALEESADKLEQQRHVLQAEKKRASAEMNIKKIGLQQMQQAAARLETGLQLMQATIAALTVRAPIAGRLTDFHLQVGEAVTLGQHLGRIDNPADFKLVAEVDEYYLNRIVIGCSGKVQIGTQSLEVSVSRIYPQIANGHFTIDLVFSSKPTLQLNPGQSLDVQILLGSPTPAHWLPAASFGSDSAGAWVFVLSADSNTAQRRAIRIGRRSNRQIEITEGLKPGEKVIISDYAKFGQAQSLQLSR